MAQKNSRKSITLSFGKSIQDDLLVINDNISLPKTNLDGILIDLTNENITPTSTSKENRPKTIELSMMLTEQTTELTPKRYNLRKSKGQLLDIANNNKPQVKSKANIENNYPQPSTSTHVPCYKKLLEISEKCLVENSEEFTCSICNNFVAKNKGVTLHNCLHDYCRPCLVQNIYNNHESTGTVKCPSPTCESNLEDKEIETLLGNNYPIFLEQIRVNMETMAQNINYPKMEHSDESLLPLLLNMDDVTMIPNLSSFECSICFVEIDVGEGVILKSCLHKFCKDCLVGCVQASDEFQVKCPHIENEKICSELIQEGEVRCLLSKEEFDMHLLKSLKQAENENELTFHCRSADCPAFVEIDDANIREFRCQVCQKVNCIACKAIHEGKSCIDYQEDMNPNLKDERIRNENFKSESAIQKLIEENKAMLCPRCKIAVSKVSGCDFISCSVCKLGLCWVTKKPRKDLTKADGTIIEGCKCKEPPNYKPCHPACGNCH